MARIVLGICTSHTPMLSIPPELWETYAQRDRQNRELMFPPEGVNLPFDEAVAHHVPAEVRARLGDEASYKEQFARCQAALDTLRDSLAAAKPDVTVIISDDQDEWFFEGNMPAFSVFWGDSVPVKPRKPLPNSGPFMKYIIEGYGDVALDVPVPSALGRHVIEQLMDRDFDVSHVAYTEELYGGRITRRYPTPEGETDATRETEPREVGLPHGFSFIVKRLFDSKPTPILPVFQNTCYPPNQVRPARAYDFGVALAAAIESWPEDLRVAVAGSGGLSHFVVDEELDRGLLGALQKNDAETLRTLPRHRLYSATSESLNWVATGGAMAGTGLEADLLDYVPVYRTEAGTGGGWGFLRWQ